MNVEVLPDAPAVATRGAEIIAAAAKDAIAARDQFVLAASGGTTPWAMYAELAKQPLLWDKVHLCQTDERCAPQRDPARNLFGLRAALGLVVDQIHVHAMPVDAPPRKSPDGEPITGSVLEATPARYALALAQVCGGVPPVLDLVHLGLGDDGHTASLVPGDEALEAATDVALTAEYRGWRRLTLTFPALDRARQVLWIVTGSGKAAMLKRLVDADGTIPAGRVSQRSAMLLADAGAASLL